MNTFSLWIEISISGFFYAIALFFFILTIFEIKDLTFFHLFKDYLALAAAGVTIISYLFGILTHRLLQPLRRFPLFIKMVFRKQKTEAINKDTLNSKRYSVDLWQYGSDRLHKELDFQFSLQSLFFLLIIGAPLAGLFAAIWFWKFSNPNIGTTLILMGFVFGLLNLIAYKIQHKAYEKFLEAAMDEMRIIKKKEREKS